MSRPRRLSGMIRVDANVTPTAITANGSSTRIDFSAPRVPSRTAMAMTGPSSPNAPSVRIVAPNGVGS
jgi:hypothetical protein